MSGRFAIIPLTKFRTARLAFVVFGGLVCGACGDPCNWATAQPTTPPNQTEPGAKEQPEPRPPTKQESIARGGKADAKNPIPNDAPGRHTPDKYKFDHSGRIFQSVTDFGPIASETEISDEYQAWIALVAFANAKRMVTAELEQYGARDLTPSDLVRPSGGQSRFELIHFDGKLVSVRRLELPLYFKDNPESGIAQLYEARFVPVDDSPLIPVSIVFTELPDGFADVAKKPAGEWVERDSWLSAAGYYFKTISVPGAKGSTLVGVPVLAGKGITVRDGPPVVVPGDPTALDPELRVYESIKDEAPMVRTDTFWQEAVAYDRVIVHAARFSAAELEDHALTKVNFADLFEPVRRDYKLKNVKLEGRLIRLRQVETTKELKAAGVNQLFEGWLVPANEARGNPVCIVFTEPLAGVEPADRVNSWVTFAGFSFKKLKYESAEPDPENPSRYLKKYAPLLIGKCPIVRRDPDGPSAVTWSSFVGGVLGGVGLVLVVAAALTYFFRRGDRKAKEAMDAVRHRNPFDPAAAPVANSVGPQGAPGA